MAGVLQAILRGKLSRDNEQIEDILTSNVFGLLKYSVTAPLLKFLSLARTPDGTVPLERVASYGDKVQINWEFWPYWSIGGCLPCEPDVVLTLRVAGQAPTLVLIEAKLNSGKSRLADDAKVPVDQLAREWDNLLAQAQDIEAQPVLVYLTGHFSMPRFEIRESEQEYIEMRGSCPIIAWLSWRDLLPILRRHQENGILDDLVALLERMDLTYFQGIRPVIPVEFEWRFRRDNARFSWRIGNVPDISWRFL
jgi:hypothetical protein